MARLAVNRLNTIKETTESNGHIETDLEEKQKGINKYKRKPLNFLIKINKI